MKTIILFIALSFNIFAQSNLIILMSSDPTVAGGDSLGADLLVNGTMETAFDGEWVSAFADVVERSNTRAHAGTYSCKVTTSGAGGGQQTITVETGITYWIEGYIWIVSGSCKINVDAGQLGDQIETLGEWVYFKRQFTAGDTETFIRVNANENVTEYYFDDITVKELL